MKFYFKIDGIACSEWGQWTQCSASCGNGTISRQRQCKNMQNPTGNRIWDHGHVDIGDCNSNIPCPGKFTGWLICGKICKIVGDNSNRYLDTT